MNLRQTTEAIDVRYSGLAESNCCLSCGGAIDLAQPQAGETCVDLRSGRGQDVIRLAEADLLPQSAGHGLLDLHIHRLDEDVSRTSGAPLGRLPQRARATGTSPTERRRSAACPGDDSGSAR